MEKDKTCKVCNETKPASAFRKEHKSCRKCLAHADRARKFGITIEELDQLIDHDSCDICGHDFSEVKLCIDHSHKTNKIRGVLCNRCNTALGLFKDDINRMLNAIEYLDGQR